MIINELKKVPAVFTDFDGTITKIDLGDELFRQYGEFEPHHSKLVAGELSIRDYWKIVCAGLKTDVDKDLIRDFAFRQEVDPYFKVYAEYCRENGIPLTVVSDGFAEYIGPVLEGQGLEWIEVKCNRMNFNGQCITPEFPMASESCGCLSASCKRNSLLANTPDDQVIVYIGDGYSDFCGASHSDIVFAKQTLAAYCNEMRIPHYPFSNFFDVYRIFRDIVKKGKLKTRHQAMLLRKKAFEVE